MKSGEFLERLLVVALITGVSCGSSRTSVSQYMDGCRDKQGFLRRESLALSSGEPVTVGRVEFRPPSDSYLRIQSDSVSIIQGVYCDSGDWGIDPGNLIRLKLYPGHPAADLYTDLPEEVAHALQRKAPPTGTLDHEFSVSSLTWRSQVEFWGTVIPSIRTAYFTTAVGSQTLAVTYVAESGSAENIRNLESVLRSVGIRPDK